MKKEFRKILGTVGLYGRMESTDESFSFSLAAGNSDDILEIAQEKKQEEQNQEEKKKLDEQ